MEEKRPKKRGKRALKILAVYLIVAGAFLHLYLLWMWAGWPIFIDRLLIRSDKPEPADYIVCVGGGMGGNNLPTDAGWPRIYTAVQLYFDGWAPKIIFSGGGTEGVTEAEVYAEAAAWLGCPPEAVAFEPGANGTADHPANLLRLENPRVEKSSRLLIVTTPLHSKRVALCFAKAGFASFRMITGYTASRVKDAAKVRELKTTRFAQYKPSGKRYDDLFNRLKWRSDYFWTALREVGALLAYKVKGLI
jgi:uncharacterized SAM-binding protein YcdF (DUF218 family)